MKTLVRRALLVIGVFFLFIFTTSAKERITERYNNGIRLLMPRYEKAFNRLSKDCRMSLWMRMSDADTTYLISMRVRVEDNGTPSDILVGNQLIMKLNDDQKIALRNVTDGSGVKVDGGAVAYSIGYTAIAIPVSLNVNQALYPLTKEELNAIIKKGVSKVRIEFETENLDVNIMYNKIGTLLKTQYLELKQYLREHGSPQDGISDF